MIQKLGAINKDQAKILKDLFFTAFKIEASMFGIPSIPPMERELQAFIGCPTDFIGYYKRNTLAGVIEIRTNKNSVHIQSLAVHPNFFKMGIASGLLDYAFENYASKLYTVETGVINDPAIRLYEKFGFREVARYDTDHNTVKIKFELSKV